MMDELGHCYSVYRIITFKDDSFKGSSFFLTLMENFNYFSFTSSISRSFYHIKWKILVALVLRFHNYLIKFLSCFYLHNIYIFFIFVKIDPISHHLNFKLAAKAESKSDGLHYQNLFLRSDKTIFLYFFRPQF